MHLLASEADSLLPSQKKAYFSVVGDPILRVFNILHKATSLSSVLVVTHPLINTEGILFKTWSHFSFIAADNRYIFTVVAFCKHQLRRFFEASAASTRRRIGAKQQHTLLLSQKACHFGWRQRLYVASASSLCLCCNNCHQCKDIF